MELLKDLNLEELNLNEKLDCNGGKSLMWILGYAYGKSEGMPTDFYFM